MIPTLLRISLLFMLVSGFSFSCLAQGLYNDLQLPQRANDNRIGTYLEISRQRNQARQEAEHEEAAAGKKRIKRTMEIYREYMSKPEIPSKSSIQPGMYRVTAVDVADDFCSERIVHVDADGKIDEYMIDSKNGRIVVSSTKVANFWAMVKITPPLVDTPITTVEIYFLDQLIDSRQ